MPDRAGRMATHQDSGTAVRGPRVAIAGRGLLATAISETLSAGPYPGQVRAYDVADGPSDLGDLVGDEWSPDGQLLVTASDGWDCRGYDRIQELCAAHQVSWLPVRTELGRTVIGPC